MHQSAKEKFVLQAVNRSEQGDYRETLATSSMYLDEVLLEGAVYSVENRKVAPRMPATRRNAPQ